MTRIATALCLSLTLAALSSAQTLPDRIQSILDADPITHRTHVSVLVADAETGEVIHADHPDRLFTPASNVKMYTSAWALDHYGPDHTFSTWVGTEGTTSGGVLRGDLVLTGDGDPTLTSEILRTLAQRVANELGIERIEGDVVIDDSRIAPRRKGPGWMWDDDPDEYNMSIASLMVDYNVLTAVVEGGQGRLEPPSDYPPIEGRTAPGSAISRQPFEDVIVIDDAATATDTLTMHDPATWIANLFAEMLRTEGIEITGEARVSSEPIPVRPEASVESVPMSEIIALFNKPSENAIGEMLIHNIAADSGETPATWGGGARLMSEWLVQEAGLRDGDFRLVDGSGLSRYNLICASGTVQLLRHMYAHPSFEIYRDSLTIPGVDGTARSRMAGTAAAGNVHGKSGTMSGVSCWSGYATTAGGRDVVFSVLTNGYIGSSGPARDLQDRICVAICEAE